MCQENERPLDDAVIGALNQAWQDHHHMRDQTWRVVQMEAMLCAGLVAVEFTYGNVATTVLGAILVALIGYCGFCITWHHRKREKEKFQTIAKCQEQLRLSPGVIEIPEEEGKDQKDPIIAPKTLREALLCALNLRKNNTFLFLCRLHLVMILFSLLVAGTRLVLAIG